MDSKKLLVVVALIVVVVAVAAVAVSMSGDDTPSEPPPDSDEVGDLVVFGNANNDTVVDMKDVEYIQDVLKNKEPKTKFCDANHDNEVNEADIDHVKDMIAKKDGTKVWFIDAMEGERSVEWPINRIIALSNSPQVMALSVGLDDKIVGYTKEDKFLYQNWKNAQLISAGLEDYETIFKLNPDAVIVGNSTNGGEQDMQNPVLLETYAKRGIDIISTYNMEGELSASSGLTLGYLCDSFEQATEYYNWCKDMFKEINDIVNSIPMDKRKTAMVIYGGGSVSGKGYDYTKALEAAGGINVANDFEGYKWVNDDNGRWVYNYDPEVLFRIMTIGYGKIIDHPNDAGFDSFNRQAEKFKALPAVEDGHMYLIDFSMPQTLRIAYMAEILYPEKFAPGFADGWHSKLLDIYGLDFDVDGQFVVSSDDVKGAA